MKGKGSICFCPASIKWIAQHLMKSARPKFKNMIINRVFKPNLRVGARHVFKGKRRFSRKQLAAQRLFAKRARAGTLRRGRRRRSRNSR